MCNIIYLYLVLLLWLSFNRWKIVLRTGASLRLGVPDTNDSRVFVLTWGRFDCYPIDQRAIRLGLSSWCLNCLLTECSMKIWIKWKIPPNNPLIKTGLVYLIRVKNSIQLNGCGHLLGNDWPLRSRFWYLLWRCHFPICILGDCIYSWALPSFLL